MKLRILTVLTLLALCIPALSSMAGLRMLASNSAVVSAANVAGFTTPPGGATPWTQGSFVGVTNQGPGNQNVTITVPSIAATFHVYYSVDGLALNVLPDAGILCNETGAFGPIASGVARTYTATVPPASNSAGGVWLGCSAYVSGTGTATLNTSNAWAAMPGISDVGVLPLNYNPLRVCVRDLSGTGTTVYVSYEDSSGTPIPLIDSNSVAWDSVSIAVPASTTWGLSWALLNQVKPDGSHIIASLPSSPVTVRITVVSGGAVTSATLSVNFGGTIDGAAGTGTTGFSTGYGASIYTPTQMYVNSQRAFGRVRN